MSWRIFLDRARTWTWNRSSLGTLVFHWLRRCESICKTCICRYQFFFLVEKVFSPRMGLQGSSRRHVFPCSTLWKSSSQFTLQSQFCSFCLQVAYGALLLCPRTLCQMVDKQFVHWLPCFGWGACTALIHASQFIHAVVASIWGVRLGWLGRMRGEFHAQH